MFSANQRNDMWRRLKTRQSLHEIGRAFGKDHTAHSGVHCQNYFVLALGLLVGREDLNLGPTDNETCKGLLLS
jgi:hypothetical protein